MMGMDQDDILLGAVDDDQIPRGRLLSCPTVNQSSATAATSTQVNTLSQIYPDIQQNLYPVPSATEQADTPQPVRFANVDQILTAAQSGDQIPSAIQEIGTLLRERHHLRAPIRTISTSAT